MELLCLAIIGIGVILVLVWIKNTIWDRPHDEINKLKRDNEALQRLHKEEISKLQERLQSNIDFHALENEFTDIAVSYAWKEILELYNKEYAFLNTPGAYISNVLGKEKVIASIILRFREAIDEQYKYQYLTYLYPELANIFHGETGKISVSELQETIDIKSKSLFEVVNLLKKNPNQSKTLIYLKNRIKFLEASNSNLTAIPYMAEIMADYETYGIEHLAKELDWGYAANRMHKVKSIREIRRDARAIVEKNKESQYQLAYLLNLFPNLEDVINTDFNQLPVIKVSELSDYDSTRDYLSKEEYDKLSTVERNQLALDRYRESHNKSKWQIGRDYELYVGYKYTQMGYDVDYFGSYMGLEDLGRDLIAKKDNEIHIVQCKYWSNKKQIHEKHVNQLYGTMASYCIEHECNKENIKGVLVTNIELSPMAKKMAAHLDIKYVENFESGNYPCIKCNIGHDAYGETTKIYHLPFDQQYDSTKIKNKGEFYAATVAEAEAAGFRRAFKWFGSQ